MLDNSSIEFSWDEEVERWRSITLGADLEMQACYATLPRKLSRSYSKRQIVGPLCACQLLAWSV